MGLAARFGRRGVSQCLDAQTRVHIYLCKFNAALCRVGLAARSYSLSMPLSLEPNRWKKVREPEGDEERFQRFERNVGNVSANFCCEECSRKTLSRPCSCSHLDTRWFGWYFIYLLYKISRKSSNSSIFLSSKNTKASATSSTSREISVLKLVFISFQLKNKSDFSAINYFFIFKVPSGTFVFTCFWYSFKSDAQAASLSQLVNFCFYCR